MAIQGLADVAHNFSVCISLFLFCHLTFIIPVSSELGLGNLVDIFSALAGEDTCVFKCPTGAILTKNDEHKPHANGCGTYGLKLITEDPGFEECCNKHDICYDTCENKKEDCDNDFKECLKDSCHLKAIKSGQDRKKLKKCEEMVDLMYAGTFGLGCQAFLESQRNACLCNKRKLSKKQLQRISEEL